MSGFRNVFGQIVVILDILVISLMLMVHLYLSKQDKKADKVPIGNAFIIAFVLFFVILHHFVRNHKLRLVSLPLSTEHYNRICLGVTPRRRF
jgi:hypothetical protein